MNANFSIGQVEKKSCFSIRYMKNVNYHDIFKRLQTIQTFIQNILFMEKEFWLTKMNFPHE